MTGILSDTAVQIGGAAGAGALGFFARSILLALRGDRAWERGEVSELRKALDRAWGRENRIRRRENAYATSCEIFLLVMPHELTRDQRKAVERAKQLFETALIPPAEGH